MKIIDLLNKIANGEDVPKKIKYHNDIHILQKNNKALVNYYYCEEKHCHLFGTYYGYCLNDEVEVIEEDKKIEKLYTSESLCHYYLEHNRCDAKEYKLANKINEIIDKVNEMEDK